MAKGVSEWAEAARIRRMCNPQDAKGVEKTAQSQVQVLSEQEQIVVDMRWGLGESRSLSRKELSAHLSISQERIRQIES